MEWVKNSRFLGGRGADEEGHAVVGEGGGDEEGGGAGEPAGDAEGEGEAEDAGADDGDDDVAEGLGGVGGAGRRRAEEGAADGRLGAALGHVGWWLAHPSPPLTWTLLA